MDRLLKGKDFSKDLKNNSVYPHTLRAAQDAKTAEYYEEVIIPQKIKETGKKLIEEIEILLPFCPCYRPDFSDCEGCIHENKTDTVTRFKFNGEIMTCKDLVWQQLKQSRGIE